MRIASRYNGPPGSANGGVAAGRLAAYVGAPAVEVTLRRPPPLDRDLRVDASGGTARLYDGDLLVADAAPSSVEVALPEPVTLERAREAEASYAGLTDHAFSTCYGCGPASEHGLHLRPGPVADGVVACTWTPASDDPVDVWTALDCPAGWSAATPERPMVLGRMALAPRARPVPGAPHVVVGWTVAFDGRKVHTGSALHAPDGTLVAVARGTWLVLEPAGR